MKVKNVKIGMLVEAGDTDEDFDFGVVDALDGDMVTVRWKQSKTTTAQTADGLRPHNDEREMA